MMDEKKNKQGTTADEDGETPEIIDEPDLEDFELEHDDAEPDDRRRDPLRKP